MTTALTGMDRVETGMDRVETGARERTHLQLGTEDEAVGLDKPARGRKVQRRTMLHIWVQHMASAEARLKTTSRIEPSNSTHQPPKRCGGS